VDDLMDILDKPHGSSKPRGKTKTPSNPDPGQVRPNPNRVEAPTNQPAPDHMDLPDEDNDILNSPFQRQHNPLSSSSPDRTPISDSDPNRESSPDTEDCEVELPEIFIEPMTLPEGYKDTQTSSWRERRAPDTFVPGTAETDDIIEIDKFNKRTAFLTQMERVYRLEAHVEVFDTQLDQALTDLNSGSTIGDVGGCLILAANIAVQAQKDMSWQKALASDDRIIVTEAFNKEKASLIKCILQEMSPTDKDWETAIREATPGRWLLDIKRAGHYKCRGVKQGFKENKVISDGPDFNYHSSVVKFVTVRIVLARQREGRVIAMIDISTAFLQSNPYEDGMFKYIAFKNPFTFKWEYYRQSGPIYGEASAPVRWEVTIAPWLIEQGFTRGINEPCVFHHEERDLLLLLYVDDILADGQPEDVKWIFDQLAIRFECKDPEYLTPEQSLDYLGMDVSMDDDNIHISMQNYINNACDILDIKGGRIPDTPIVKPIEHEASELLPPDQVRTFLTAVGMLGWLSNTVRCDISYAYSRIAQHSAKPSQAALAAVMYTFAYLRGTSEYSITIPLHEESRSVMDFDQPPGTVDPNWRFMTDSDHAGNAEIQNRRRSQNGLCVTLNGAPVQWFSKASSVAFASPLIEEAHADTSSAAVELYAAGNATQELMGLSYIVDEMNIEFPIPFTLEMDNAAAKIFCDGTASKTRLKHIDARQEWVQTLRNKNIVKAQHVPSEHNLADIFTKILPKSTFIRLRDQLLKPLPAALRTPLLVA
jgi:hypothetical protein